MAENLGVVFGDGQTLERLFVIAGDDKADPQMRTAAVTALLRSQHSDVLPSLKKWVSDRVLAPAVIRGFAKFEDNDIPRLTINMYGRLTPEGQSACIDTLCSRPQYALALLAAIERGTISRAAVSAYHARQIQSLGSEEVNTRLAKVWGEVRESSADKLAEMQRLKAELTADRIAHANASAGRAIFQKTCAACHALYGQGGRIGPDLTGSNRRNLDYLLENLVDPSALVAADYRMSIVVLMDGRVMTGVIADQNERTLTVQTEKERFVVDRRDVDGVTPTALSLMPEGMTKTFTLDQITDLTAYLMSPRQVPLTDAVSEAN